MRNPYKKFQNPSMVCSLKLCYASKSVTNGRTDERPRSNVPLQPSKLGAYSGCLLITVNLFIKFQGASVNSFFFNILLTRFYPYFFQRAITQERGLLLTRQKIHVNYFFMRSPYMEFQNLCMHCSKVMLCIKKYAM